MNPIDLAFAAYRAALAFQPRHPAEDAERLRRVELAAACIAFAVEAALRAEP